MISLNAFSSEQNANKFLQEISKNPDYSDYQADIVITDKGLYRVALRGFKTYDEAKAFIETHAIKGHIVKE
nr:SPOR domain-containing protein [Helicobacter saguini]